MATPATPPVGQGGAAWTHTRQALPQLESLLRCPICHELLQDAHRMGNCDHHFCRECIEGALDDKPECPVCKLPAWRRSLKKDPWMSGMVSCIAELGTVVRANTAAAAAAVAAAGTGGDDSISAPPSRSCGRRAARRTPRRTRAAADEGADEGADDEALPCTPVVIDRDALVPLVRILSSSQQSPASRRRLLSQAGVGIEAVAMAAEQAEMEEDNADAEDEEKQAEMEEDNADAEDEEDDADDGDKDEDEAPESPEMLSGRPAEADARAKQEQEPGRRRGTRKRAAPPEEEEDEDEDEEEEDILLMPDNGQTPPRRRRRTNTTTGRKRAAGSAAAAEKTSSSTAAAAAAASTPTPTPTPPAAKAPAPVLKRRASSGRSGRSNKAARNARGESQLQQACIQGDEAEVRRLLAEGANVDDKDNAGWTPLHEACNHGFAAIAKMLIEAGADVNAPGMDFETPLHDAVQNGHREIVELLLAHGANANAVNKYNRTPTEAAREQGPEMQALLQAASLAVRRTRSTLPNQPTADTPLPAPPQLEEIVVLFSGLTQQEKSTAQKTIEGLGGRISSQFSESVTHLVVKTDENGVCRRTVKYLTAVVAGKWIVTVDWLTSCKRAHEWVAEGSFEIERDSCAAYAPRKSRENSWRKRPRLFDGCSFFLHSKLKADDKKNLLQLVTLGGGKVLHREPVSRFDEGHVPLVPFHAADRAMPATIVVLPEELEQQRAELQESCVDVLYADPQWVFDCISHMALRQQWEGGV